jgi:hypothetical protein
MSPLLIQVFLALQAQAYTGEMNWTCEEAERKLRVSVSYRGTAKCCVAKTHGGTDWREDSLLIYIIGLWMVNFDETFLDAVPLLLLAWFSPDIPGMPCPKSLSILIQCISS